MPVSASLLAASGALRVASLNLCTDEYLLLLARPEEIASVSRLSHDPADSQLAGRARRYPANRGTIESALAHRPTMILTMGGGGRSTARLASRLHLRTVDIAYPSTVADVEATMLRVATALGDPKRASGWRRRLARLRSNVPAARDALYLSAGGASLSPGSLGAEWMRLAGLEQRSVAGGRVSLETLALNPPKVLLRSNYRRSQPSLGQRWLEHPLVERLSQRSVMTDGRPWTCAGPLMLGEIQRLWDLK